MRSPIKTNHFMGGGFFLPISGFFEMRMGGFFQTPIGGLFDANTHNTYFKIIDGPPKLGRQEKKAMPAGFKQWDDALRKKLDGMGLSLLDVLILDKFCVKLFYVVSDFFSLRQTFLCHDNCWNVWTGKTERAIDWSSISQDWGGIQLIHSTIQFNFASKRAYQ